ncbi:xylulokinase [Homoserinimonas sp. OAct 916]|uniref:xylulokinase n=1 Tax=Homoserinimonas sp. OAct 916 TaxID=2211450 RepID=UPI000DBE9FC9|nr:FGGY family carbohydrate kinase [Homoserinimonas sp. OAct 916]
MTPQTLVAGVDSSTQSCKVVIRECESGRLVRSGRAAHPNGTEVDPEQWWLALAEAVVDAGGISDVAALSIAGQQHGMVALDEFGRVIRDALLWNDSRSAEAAADLIDEFGAAELARRTGLVPVASFTISKLRWLRDTEPENASRVAAVALPHDWLTWRLRGFGPVDESAGRRARFDELVTDRSDASGTGYWNPSTGEYDRDLLRAALGRDCVLPRVLGPAEPAGVTQDGVVIGPGAGDNAAAALGLGAEVGDVVLSLGTSGTAYIVADEGTADATGLVAGFADASGRALPLVATLNAARVLDAACRLLEVDHDQLAELALAAEPGAGGLVLQPYFEGERTPNLPDATATLFGMTLKNSTSNNLARASFEGMLCGLADGVDAVRGPGTTAKRILLIGGAARNAAVQEIATQVFDLPISVPGFSEYVADGAAAQAAWVLTGSRPRWPIELVSNSEPRVHPVIRAQYSAR